MTAAYAGAISSVKTALFFAPCVQNWSAFVYLKVGVFKHDAYNYWCTHEHQHALSLTFCMTYCNQKTAWHDIASSLAFAAICIGEPIT